MYYLFFNFLHVEMEQCIQKVLLKATKVPRIRGGYIKGIVIYFIYYFFRSGKYEHLNFTVYFKDQIRIFFSNHGF